MFTIDCCCGMMPNQAWGTLDGHPFYFRARHGLWRLDLGYATGEASWERIGTWEGEPIACGGTQDQNNPHEPDGWWPPEEGKVELWLVRLLMTFEGKPPEELFKNYPGSIACTT